MNNVNQKEIITLEMTEEEVERMKGAFEIEEDIELPASSGEIQGKISIALGGRRNQQDSGYLAIDPANKVTFAIVCDGMGGLQGGELASELSVKTFVNDFESCKMEENNFYYFFQSEAKKVDQMVSQLKSPEGDFLDAGTTLVAVVIKNDQLQWISVGDSKIYVIRGDEIVSVAKEHNYLNMLNDQLLSGEISMEEYEREQPRGAALTSYIGMGNVEMMELNYEPLTLLDGDIIILASDGLYKGVEEAMIYEIARNTEGEIQDILDILQQKVTEACGPSQDNTTIIMMKYNK